MNKKILIGDLDHINDRLTGCGALVSALAAMADTSTIPEAALMSIEDLLDSICKDIQGLIDTVDEAMLKEAV